MTMVRLAAGVAVVAALSLSGCSEARRALGYDKTPPDEFVVVARAPLSQPPDFTLRPPMPGVPRPQEGTQRDQAKSFLVGGKAPGSVTAQAAGRSDGELLILNKVGLDRIEPNIRRKVDEETTLLVQADDSFTDKVLFWQSKPTAGEVVDAPKEAHRLQENAALGKPANAGSSPQIIRRQKGWLEDIF